MNKVACRPILARVARTFALGLLAALAPGCERSGPQATGTLAAARSPQSFVLATTPYAGAAPVFVAIDTGLFEREGLAVTVQRHPSGKAALDAVLNGSADVATVAELPVALAVVQGHPVTILASLSTQTDYGVVGRTDRGVSAPASLAGKRIAVTVGTSAHFMLDAMLVRQRLTLADVQVIDRKPSEMADTLGKGEADAVATWEPHVAAARRRVGPLATVFSSGGIYESTFNLASTRAFAHRRGEAVRKILRAMIGAQELMASDPAAGERIVAKTLGAPAEEARALMGKNRYAVSLGQNLLVMMEDEARWAVKNKVAEGKRAPNFLDAIYIDGLADISPRSVTVIR